MYRCNISWSVAVSGRGTVYIVVTLHGLWLFQAEVHCVSNNISWTLVVSGGGTGCFVIAFRGLWMFQAEVHCVS